MYRDRETHFQVKNKVKFSFLSLIHSLFVPRLRKKGKKMCYHWIAWFLGSLHSRSSSYTLTSLSLSSHSFSDTSNIHTYIVHPVANCKPQVSLPKHICQVNVTSFLSPFAGRDEEPNYDLEMRWKWTRMSGEGEELQRKWMSCGDIDKESESERWNKITSILRLLSSRNEHFSTPLYLSFHCHYHHWIHIFHVIARSVDRERWSERQVMFHWNTNWRRRELNYDIACITALKVFAFVNHHVHHYPYLFFIHLFKLDHSSFVCLVDWERKKPKIKRSLFANGTHIFHERWTTKR